MKRHFNWRLQIAPFGFSLVLLWATILINEDAPVEATSRQASQTIVHANQAVVMHVESVRNLSDCTSVLTRSWVDSDERIISQNKMFLGPRPQGRYVSDVNIVIPFNAQPGHLEMRTNGTFMCNWLQKLLNWGDTVALPTLNFTVIGESSDANVH